MMLARSGAAGNGSPSRARLQSRVGVACGEPQGACSCLACPTLAVGLATSLQASTASKCGWQAGWLAGGRAGSPKPKAQVASYLPVGDPINNPGARGIQCNKACAAHHPHAQKGTLLKRGGGILASSRPAKQAAASGQGSVRNQSPLACSAAAAAAHPATQPPAHPRAVCPSQSSGTWHAVCGPAPLQGQRDLASLQVHRAAV